MLALLALALAGLAAYRFAYGLWVMLEMIPTEVIVGGLGLMWCIALVAYIRWMMGKLRKPRLRVGLADAGYYDDVSPAAIRRAAQHLEPKKSVPTELMHALEQDTQDWSLLGGNQPGSVAAAAIGMEHIDKWLEQEYD